jgi:hypothetical protein
MKAAAAALLLILVTASGASAQQTVATDEAVRRGGIKIRIGLALIGIGALTVPLTTNSDAEPATLGA